MKKAAWKLLIFVGLGSTMVHGQASSTWVSGVGDDSNPCSRTAPCKTWAGAVAKTASGGEVDALDPGGFGAVTITKAITLDGGGGQVASILVSGTNAIVIQAGASDVVILRNLSLDGLSAGINGIRFLSGKDLQVENCFIFNFLQNGIDIALDADASVHVLHTVVKNVGQAGIRAANSTGATKLAVVNSQITVTNIGIEASDHSNVVISNSLVDSAFTAGVQADASTASTVKTAVFISNSELSFNGTGVQSGPGDAEVSVSDSRLAFNTTEFNRAGGRIFIDDNESPHRHDSF